MKYHELTVKKHRQAKRVGRGIAGGQGKTAGRGTKGQKARTGWSLRPGFAGGQNPLMQQLPKLPGFRSIHAKTTNVYTKQLNLLKESTITADSLAKAGFIEHPYQAVKLLNNGDIKRSLNVSLPAASASAIEAIEQAGGTFKKVDRIPRTSKSDSKAKANKD